MQDSTTFVTDATGPVHATALDMSGSATYTIREYRDDDLSALRDCVIELQDFERRIDDRLRPGASMADDYLHEMIGRCRDCAGTILVAECDSIIAGFAMVLTRVPFESLDDPPGHYAIVAELVVREAFRRRGLGAALLAESERYARESGAAELRIAVLSDNRTAAELYRRVGFVPYSEVLAKRLDGDRSS
jgi:ribosomal protein S18 acetylase RimI-like enzyme